MAYSPNTTNLFGRRRALALFLTGLGGTITASRAAAAAMASTPVTDSQLFARWREYLKSEIELNAAQDARDLVSWNARQAHPPKPDCIGDGWVTVIPSAIGDDVEALTVTTDMKSGRQPADERMAEIKAWVEKCNEINIRFGLPELESAFKAAWDGQWLAFARFVSMPAATLAGLALKTSAIFYFEDQTRRAWRGRITDHKKLEPEQQILLTLRRDLLRMAGLPDDFAMEYAEVDEQYFATTVLAPGGTSNDPTMVFC